MVAFIVGLSVTSYSQASDQDVVERCIYTAEIIGQIKDHRDGNGSYTVEEINERFAESDEGVQMLANMYNTPEYYDKFESGYHAYIETVKDCTVAMLSAKNIRDMKKMFE